jgi:hypothetical protein
MLVLYRLWPVDSITFKRISGERQAPKRVRSRRAPYKLEESFVRELQRKRELVAGRVAKLDPSKKEYAWEKEELDDLDRAIKKLRSEVSVTDDEPRFF